MIVPLVSPLTDDSMSLSEIRLSRLIDFHKDHGAAGFLVASEAGEVFAMSHAERKQLVEWTVRDAKGLPVVVNVSASTTAAVLDLAQHAERHGAYAGVLTTPLLIGLTAEEESGYLASVHRYANLICTVLNLPNGSPEGSDRSLKTLAEGDHGRLALTDKPSSEEFFGSIGLCSSYGVLGADKVEKLEAAPHEVLDLVQALFKKYRSHRVGKTWLASLGMEIGPLRSPLRSLTGQSLEALERLRSIL